MGRAYGMRGRDEKCRQMFWKKNKETGLLEDLSLHGSTILKWT